MPICKSGSKEDAKNYIPVVILSGLTKTFEKLVLLKITPLVKNVISHRQHGFCQGRSTVTNLVFLRDGGYKVNFFVERMQTDVIYLDFSKAFDKVNHSRLLMKLNANGILGRSYEWFRS